MHIYTSSEKTHRSLFTFLPFKCLQQLLFYIHSCLRLVMDNSYLNHSSLTYLYIFPYLALLFSISEYKIFIQIKIDVICAVATCRCLFAAFLLVAENSSG